MKAQTDFMEMVGVIIVLLIVGVISLYAFSTITSHVSQSINTTSPSAAKKINDIRETMFTFYDYAIIFIMLSLVAFFLISSFLIDTHPIFVIVYVVSIALSFFFIPSMIKVVERIWSQPQMAEAVSHLTITQFFLNHFMFFYLGVIFLSFVVIYAKIRRNEPQI